MTVPGLTSVSYNDPHEPFVCPESWFSSVDTDKMELFEDYHEGEFDDKPPFYKSVYETGTWPEDFKNENFGVPCAGIRTDLEGKQQQALQATLGMVAMIDHKVGRILDTLEKSGQIDNTLVVFTSDHGELHKHHGFWHKGLFAYNDCQRIPYLVWGPNIVKNNEYSSALVNLVDLPRIFLELGGIPVPQGMQGVSLMPILKGDQSQVQEATMVELQATNELLLQLIQIEN